MSGPHPPTAFALIGPAPRIAIEHAGAGELLVMLHGIGGNRGNWRDQLPAFAGHFHVAAWDARGYGDSDDYDGALVFGDFADDLLRVLDHFDAGRAHLLGLSLGGRIALDFAERHPQRLASLTLCSTHLGFDAMPPRARGEFVRLRSEPLLAGRTPREMAPEVARTLIGPQAPAGVFERLLESMARLHPASYIKTVEASVWSDGARDLTAIAVPTHVIVGAGDRVTPPKLARRIAGEIPGARLTEIPDAGHLVNIEAPASFNAAVLDFLLSLGQPR